jgi:hypothetical protein
MNDFNEIVDSISHIGSDWHSETILKNSIKNAKFAEQSISDLPRINNQESAIVISAGPSLHENNSLEIIAKSNFNGLIIAVDGSYVNCLKHDIYPDYVLTLDPHPTRLVRWFGDPEYEKNSENDDYFLRQDLDVDFRTNDRLHNLSNIELVNKHASKSKLVIASTASESVVNRVLDAGFDLFWYVPLVDNPKEKNSFTRKMHFTMEKPAMNTGGNVGTAAWVFAQFWLKLKKVAVVGMDLGCAADYPYNKTQTYYELLDMLDGDHVGDEYFPRMINPLTSKVYYTEPTYFWYRQNLLDLIANSPKDIILYNCTESGILFGDGIICMKLIDFLGNN